MFYGIGASDGLAMGKAMRIQKKEITIPTHRTKDVEKEINIFEEARKNVLTYRRNLQDNYDLDVNDGKIFGAHCQILEDEISLINPIKEIISNDKLNAALAVNVKLNEIIDDFKTIEDEYLRHCIFDAIDIKEQLLEFILNIEVVDLNGNGDARIIVANDLTPANLIELDPDKILGLITEFGNKNSHTSILTRAMGIPTIVGAKDILRNIENDDYIIFDGTYGTITINPSKEEIQLFSRRVEEQKNELSINFDEPNKTSDGKEVKLLANIGTINHVDNVLPRGGEGIGLFRTEFTYMNSRSLPTEDKQFRIYKKLAESMNGNPISIRTLDVGTDKRIPYLNLSYEENPALGYRAIRYSLDRKRVFSDQLRAIIRASHYGNISILIPMISTMRELLEVKDIIEEIKDDLDNEGIPFAKDIPLGIMVEVPSVAIMADSFAKEVDFFSIGTNDLVQFTLAADRSHEKLSKIYSPYNPAVIQLVNMTTRAAKNNHIPCYMCGETASDLNLLPLWVGLGISRLSMNSNVIPKVKNKLLTLNSNECENMAKKVLQMTTEEEIKELLMD